MAVLGGSDTCGGLKPADWRILYAKLTDLKLRPDGRYLESARVVHDAIGRYRPDAEQPIWGRHREAQEPLGVEVVEAELTGQGEETEIRITVEDISPTTRIARLAVDTDQLAERVQVLTIRATDLLGHPTVRRAAFRVDRSAPTLAPELPGVRHGTAWHTPLAEAVVARVGFEDQSPVQVEWRLNGQALVEARPALGTAALEHDLRLQDYDPGRYPMQMVVTDLLGREARIDGELVIDRAAPQIAIQPTQTVDGLDLPPDGAADDLAPIDLSPEGGLVRRWQTHWAPDAGPAAEVVFLAQDNPDGTPAEQLALRWGWCWADAEGACVNGALEANAPLPSRALPFTAGPEPADPEAPAGWLGFNPLEGPAPHEYVAITATVTDLAGNRSALSTRPVYRIEVVPPPPVVELWQTPPDDVDVEEIAPGVVVFEDLRFEDGSVGEFLRGAGVVEVVRFGAQISNPHGVPMPIQLGLGESPTLRSTLAERIVDARALNVTEMPRCAARDRSFVGAPTCELLDGLEGALDCALASCIEPAAPAVAPLDERSRRGNTHVALIEGDYALVGDQLRLAPHSAIVLVATDEFARPRDQLHGARPLAEHPDIHCARRVFLDAVSPAPPFPPPPAGRAFVRGPLLEGVTSLEWRASEDAATSLAVLFQDAEWHQVVQPTGSQVLHNSSFR